MITKLGVGILLVFAHVYPSYADPGTITTVRKLMFDVDVGGDDTVSLLMALEAEKRGEGPKILGITCVNGNVEVDQVALNVLKVLKVAGRLDIPVYKGASHPMVKPTTKDYYFGEDGFGDFEYPDPPSTSLIQSKHAVNAMIDLVKENPGELTIVALGPLTNIALAIRMYPSFLDEVQQLIIMGGSTNGRGNSRPGIEFNFFADPVSNYIVFNSSISNLPILVPYETTRNAQVTMNFRMSLSEFNNTKVWLINRVGGRSLKSEAEYWFCPDAVATTVALTSGSIVTKSGIYYSEAIYDGIHTLGMIIVDYTNITRKAANTNLIQNIDQKIYEQLILKYFSLS